VEHQVQITLTCHLKCVFSPFALLCADWAIRNVIGIVFGGLHLCQKRTCLFSQFHLEKTYAISYKSLNNINFTTKFIHKTAEKKQKRAKKQKKILKLVESDIDIPF
jgi:hypothetical protein